MEVRSYYATTVEAAMEQARRELGSDALLIQSRRTPPENAHLGRYEVIFAGERSLEPQQRPPQAAPVRPGTPAELSTARIPRSVSSLSSTLDGGRFRGDLDDVESLKPLDLLGNDSATFSSFLESAGLPESESRRFFGGNPVGPSSVRPQTPANSTTDPNPELASTFRCQPGLGRPGFSAASVALVGPPGAGKTSTLIKLAIRNALMPGTPVRIASIHGQSPAASVRLRHICELLNVECTDLATADEISGWLADGSRSLNLIDTPGFSRSEKHLLQDMANVLRTHPELETQLVLRMDRKTADNLSALERYSLFRPSRLVLTALDESEELREMRTLLESASLPVSYLSVGQRLIEDLEAASSQRLAALIATGWADSARAAA